MSEGILLVIATLCQLHGDAYAKALREAQENCQKYYVECVEQKQKAQSMNASVVSCIKEKK